MYLILIIVQIICGIELAMSGGCNWQANLPRRKNWKPYDKSSHGGKEEVPKSHRKEIKYKSRKQLMRKEFLFGDLETKIGKKENIS